MLSNGGEGAVNLMTSVLYHELHCIDMPERATYKLSAMVYHCLHATVPQYLSELCTLAADVAAQRNLQYVCQNELMLPRQKLSSSGRRVFSVTTPSVWHSLADYLRNLAHRLKSFRGQLKTFLFEHKQALHNISSDYALHKLFTLDDLCQKSNNQLIINVSPSIQAVQTSFTVIVSAVQLKHYQQSSLFALNRQHCTTLSATASHLQSKFAPQKGLISDSRPWRVLGNNFGSGKSWNFAT